MYSSMNGLRRLEMSSPASQIGASTGLAPTLWEDCHPIDLCETTMFKAGILFIAAKRISNMWSIHTREELFGDKRNQMVRHTTRWINLENIMLSKEARHRGPQLCDSTYIKYPE